MTCGFGDGQKEYCVKDGITVMPGKTKCGDENLQCYIEPSPSASALPPPFMVVNHHDDDDPIEV